MSSSLWLVVFLRVSSLGLHIVLRFLHVSSPGLRIVHRFSVLSTSLCSFPVVSMFRFLTWFGFIVMEVSSNGVAEDYIVTGFGSGRITYSNTTKRKTCSSRGIRQVGVQENNSNAVFCSRSQWPNCDDWGLWLVYLLHQDNVSLLIISSPLESHKSHTIVYSIVKLIVVLITLFLLQ